MGALTSRQRSADENLDACSNYSYKYPPHSGNRPGSFPYPSSETTDPIRPIRCVVNVRKESVKLVKVANNGGKQVYNIEFVIDADVRCSITIYYSATEEITNCGVNYISKDPSLTSDVYYYKRGANQQFIQRNHLFDPTIYNEDELLYNEEKNIYPIVIHCVALEPVDDAHQSHSTLVILDRHADGTYTLKTLKQKLFIDSICYLLQEVYGIENKIMEFRKELNDEELDDGGLECVICMNDIRDTLILPCKHLCLCQGCADSLRYQASCCPICRSPFRALLQLKAVQKNNHRFRQTFQTSENKPSGYNRITLIEALNGPVFPRRFSVLETLLESPEDEEIQVNFKKRSSKRHSKCMVVRGNCICGKDERNKAAEEGIHNPLNELSSEDVEEDEDNVRNRLQTDKFKAYGSGEKIHFVNELQNEQDDNEDSEEVLNEDNEIEKLSPLLETVVSIDGNNSSSHKVTVISRCRDECANNEIAYRISNGSSNNDLTTSASGVSHHQHSEQASSVKNVSLLGRDGTSPRPPTDDSDYYTPEEPSTTMLTSLHSEKDRNSLPGTPASLASLRSSADSYSSMGSSRLLLASSSNEKPTPV